MGKREEFISSLNKYELAFLYKYKVDTYMFDTQEYIKDAMSSKGISKEHVDDLIDEITEKAKENNLGGCPRCHSDKFFYLETVYDNTSQSAAKWDDNGFSSEMPTETTQECAVCGYKEKVNTPGGGKNRTIKNVLIVLAVMYALARLIMWIFDL